MGRNDGKAKITVEQWLKSEGILKEPPRPPRIKRQCKSIDGQQDLFERDESGKPIVIQTTDKRKRSRKGTASSAEKGTRPATKT